MSTIKISRAIIASVAAIMLSQTGAATWYSHGTFEPDNSFDDDSFLWTEPPASGTTRVYFNAYTGTSYGLRGALVSPNVGALETTNEAPTLEHHMAVFGVWVDCNGDGYVGLAETASQEYPAALLADTTVCPPVTGDINVWTAGAHNYNGWVSEYVPIAGRSDAADTGNDTRIYFDPAAMVWADNGRADDPATAGGSCPVAPQPRGTYQSTGGFINYVDCSSGLMDRYNDAFTGRRLAGQDIPGLYSFGVSDMGTRFNDPNDARGHAIWDHQTFGTEESSRSAVVLADCSKPNLFRAGDEINRTAPAPVAAAIPNGVHNVHVPTLAPQGGHPQPTVPATLNRTQEDFLENCDTSDDDGHDFYGNNYVFYVGETDFNRVSTANKTSAGWNLGFLDSNRGEFGTTVTALGRSEPVYADYPVFNGYAGAALPAPFSSNWNSPSVLLKAGPRTVRADINEGSAEINTPTTFTFYAYVGQATIDRGFDIPVGRGKYASAQCGENVDGIHNGWNCNKAYWYLNPDGSPVPEPLGPFARPGQTYQFRDTDCYDGRNSQGVPVGLTAYGPAPCQPYTG